MLREQRGIARPFAERGHPDVHHAQPVQQIESKAILFNELAERSVARRDDSDVRRAMRAASDWTELLIFEEAQQGDLRLRRQRVHFVQKEGPTVGSLDQPALV